MLILEGTLGEIKLIDSLRALYAVLFVRARFLGAVGIKAAAGLFCLAAVDICSCRKWRWYLYLKEASKI